jgi:Holliday junction resolvase RusA-like endonuclease
MDNKQQLKLICNDFISVNHYMNYRVAGKIVMAYKPKATKDFEKKFGKYVKEQAKNQGWIMPSKGKFVIIDAIFYFPRIDMDCNNYWKVMFDTITETQCVWEDDNITRERVNDIYYDSKNPRIELILSVSDRTGIFNNDNDYEEFKSKCNNCSRFKEGKCSIHKKALESRIQDEIVLVDSKWNCNKFKINKKTK